MLTLSAPSARRIFWLLLVTYFLLAAHFTFPNHGGSGLELPQNLVGWCFIALLVGLGFWTWTRRQRVCFTPLTLWFIGGALLLALPQLYPVAVSPGGAGLRLLGLAGGVALFFALQQQPWRHGTWLALLELILICTALQAAVGLIQYFVLEPGNFLGFNKLENRPYGTFQQVNVMASLMATGLLLSIYLLIGDKESRSPSIRWLAYFQVFASSLLLVVIQSRTGQLGALLGILLLLPVLLRSRLRIVFNITFLIGLGIILAFLSRTVVTQVERPLSVYEDPGARTVIYEQSADLAISGGLIGHGYGQFESSWRHHHAAEAAPSGNVIQGLHALNHPHNETLYWWVEGGVVALLGLLMLAYGFLNGLMALPTQKIGVFLALPTPILIHTQTEYPLYHSTLHWIVLVILLAFIDSEIHQRRWVRLPRVVLPAALSLLIPLLTITLMLTGLQSLLHLTQLEASKPKNYQHLIQIWNPMADIDRFQFHLMELRLLTAISQNDRDELEAFIDWVESRRAIEPRIPYFFNEVLALHALARHSEAEALLDEARYLFGDAPELAQLNAVSKGTTLLISTESDQTK
ncbi:MAG: Wzy polymerase domain-containing protein [Pseudomonadales bacterium]